MNRADLRTYWAERGYADDFDALEVLLAEHKAKLQRVIDLAAEGGRDRTAQHMLDQLAKRAGSYLRMANATLERPVFHPTHGDVGRWGRNGFAPTIDDICRSADFHASYVPMEIKTLGDGRERVAA